MQLDDIVKQLSEPNMKQIFDNSQEALVITDNNGKIRKYNPLFARLVESYNRSGEQLGKHVFLDYNFEAKQEKASLLSDAIESGSRRFSRRVEYTRRNGDKLYLNIQITPLSDKSGIQVGFADVTRETLEAMTDELTGAYTKSHYTRQLFPKEKNRASRINSYLSIIVADLRDFKIVNDTFGHQIGDNILKEATRLLHKSVRSTDYVIRYGGDEFCVLLPDTNPEAAEIVKGKIRAVLEAYNSRIKDERLKINMDFDSFSDNKSYDGIFGKADMLMYDKKQKAKNGLPR